MAKSNQAHIKGNENILLQSIHMDNQSQININNINTEDIVQELKEWYQAYNRQSLQLLVITTTQDRLSALENIAPEVLFNFYGQEPKDWKPYGKENIAELVENFSKITTLDANVRAFVVDSQNILKNEKTLAYLKLTRGQMLVIVDGLSLAIEENKNIAQIFDDVSIGGCLIPVYSKFTIETIKQIQQLKEETFKHWYIYLEEFPEKGFLYVEFDINSRGEFFRRITNIALQHLGIKVKNSKVPNFRGLNEM